MNFLIINIMISSVILAMLLLFPIFSFITSLFYKVPKVKDGFSKPVSIFIACYNEENYIKQRVDFFLNKNEWIEGSELIVISTGSTDKTNSILNDYKNQPNVQIIILEERTSKIKSLNRFVPLAKNEILIFSDCRQKLSKNAVINLVQYFANSEVSVVSSTLKDTKNNRHESIFRLMLNKIAIWQSNSGKALNLFGALYAQRKEDFTPFPEDLLFDDLFVVVNTLQKRKKIVQAKDVIIQDVAFSEYYKKERIERLVRGLLLFYYSQKTLIKKMSLYNRIVFITYKYLKLFMPFLFLNLLFCLSFIFGIKIILIFNALITLTFLIDSPITNNIRLFIRINYYIGKAVIKFIFLNQRSNKWEPLKVQA